MNDKNRLQEIFQSKKLPMPDYSSFREGGTDHQPLWITRLTLCTGNEYLSDVCLSKTNSQINAAKKALSDISNWSKEARKEPIVNKTIEERIILMVDLENLAGLVDELLEKTNIDGLTIWVFVSCISHLAKKEFDERVCNILVNSTRKDGVDVCMTAFVGALLRENEYDVYLIATRDHFGSALIDVIESKDLLWEPKIGKIVTCLEDILENL